MLILCPLGLLIAGFISGRASNSGRGIWYSKLKTSSMQPPGAVFAIVWSVLYVMLGVAVGLVLEGGGSTHWFWIQICLNLLWSPLFFSLHQIRASLALLVAIFGFAVLSCFQFRATSLLAARLMYPYLVWLIFASYLNFETIRLNPNQS